MRPLVSLLAIGCLWLMLVLGCVGSRGPQRNINTTVSRTPATSSAQPVPTVKRSRWGYSEFNDNMGRGRVYHTSIESTNTISLDSPYEGEQHAILTIREHPQHGKDVYISIERGQLLDSDFHGNVIVRFDNDKPLSFSSTRPADLSSETLFLGSNAFPVFINRLKTAKTLRIEVPVYQAGGQVFEFDVEGFTWKQAASVTK